MSYYLGDKKPKDRHGGVLWVLGGVISSRRQGYGSDWGHGCAGTPEGLLKLPASLPGDVQGRSSGGGAHNPDRLSGVTVGLCLDLEKVRKTTRKTNLPSSPSPGPL